MADRSKKDRAKLTRANDSQENSRDDTKPDALTSLRMIRSRIKKAKKTAALETSQYVAESSRDQGTAASQNDGKNEVPPTKDAAHSSSSTIQRWAQQAAEIASKISRHASSAIWSSPSKDNAATAAGDSSSSTPDSTSGWDRVDHSEVGNGQYEQFVEQQDAREYDQVDEREAESGDDGEEEVEDLGGERWDKTL